jgi:hypothetical protein
MLQRRGESCAKTAERKPPDQRQPPRHAQEVAVCKTYGGRQSNNAVSIGLLVGPHLTRYDVTARTPTSGTCAMDTTSDVKMATYHSSTYLIIAASASALSRCGRRLCHKCSTALGVARLVLYDVRRRIPQIARFRCPLAILGSAWAGLTTCLSVKTSTRCSPMMFARGSCAAIHDASNRSKFLRIYVMISLGILGSKCK